MAEYLAQVTQYERVLDPQDNGNEFDYWIEYMKRNIGERKNEQKNKNACETENCVSGETVTQKH